MTVSETQTIDFAAELARSPILLDLSSKIVNDVFRTVQLPLDLVETREQRVILLVFAMVKLLQGAVAISEGTVADDAMRSRIVDGVLYATRKMYKATLT